MAIFFGIVMALTSIVGLAFIIERGLALRWSKNIPGAVEDAADACRTPADRPVLRRICEQNEKSSPLARLLLTADEHMELPKEETESALQTRARQEIVKLERGLVVLEIVVGIAPLLGLVGTIHGMMTLFGGLSQSSLADNTALAQGISLILNFTMMGLLIAIPSLIAWSYYSKKVEMLAVEMETVCEEFIRRQYRAAVPVSTVEKTVSTKK
ncbi:MotA/TolQ/ExbB proton channel family protein [Pedosphaera parvula]|uniref:MotA/TolQ/ExbB proton channel n=1 Tax=Pedosphaera parvula (strain Ellin514) TaxID=320771 RepID=B9XNR9_PEDPL|nr:MotA/TolQ/ExbB proton channel family protein [Pedosphaera parvula]EEF58492.1 MotA/TolQ/ExbB proton channel [Pedosphaera parvula Ellin514]